jgi:hypothetical protein
MYGAFAYRTATVEEEPKSVAENYQQPWLPLIDLDSADSTANECHLRHMERASRLEAHCPHCGLNLKDRR